MIGDGAVRLVVITLQVDKCPLIFVCALFENNMPFQCEVAPLA